jgi:hypothetical protein
LEGLVGAPACTAALVVTPELPLVLPVLPVPPVPPAPDEPLFSTKTSVLHAITQSTLNKPKKRMRAPCAIHMPALVRRESIA